ncbi:MAG: hypothetical protein Q4C36_07005 [Coriobacteriia bacterium]|nr:hypothetical protein [Coriobacteriia bacterium]
MENDVQFFWDLQVIDEEELSPEERAQLPWNIEDEDEQERRNSWREEPDINLIYGYYEESEFY